VGLLVIALPAMAETASPDTYNVTFYKTEFSTDGTTWVTIYNNDAGKQIDLTVPDVGGSLCGEGTGIPAGTYTAARFTIKNEITYSWGMTITAGTSSPYPAQSADAQIVIYFNNASSTWDNDGSTFAKAFPLPDPIRIIAGVTSKIIVNFGVKNSVYTTDNWTSCDLKPPTITIGVVVLRTDITSPLTEPTEYYFIRQDIRLPAQDVAMPDWMSFESGWGTITMTPDSAHLGFGTFTIAAGADTHNSRDISNDGLGIGGKITANTEPINGKYYVDPEGFINMLMPYTNGIIRGALRSDGKVFAAIEISAPSSQTDKALVSYQMIYALKKETNTPGHLIGDYTYNEYTTEILTVEDDNGPRPDLYTLENLVSIGWANGETTASTFFDTGNQIRTWRPLSPTGQVVETPYVEYDEDTGGPITLTADSHLSMEEQEWVVTLEDESVCIHACSTVDPYEIEYAGGITATLQMLSFGIDLKAAPAGTWNTANVAGTYSYVHRSDYYNTEMGNEIPFNVVMLGRCTFDGSGNVSGRAIQAMKGQITIVDLSSYHYDVVPMWIGATPQAGSAIQIDVLRMYETDPDKPTSQLLIGNDGLTMATYNPPGDPADSSTWNKVRGLGLAVKQK